CALVEEHGPSPEWPVGLQSPAGDLVAGERDRLADRVDFHRWCQWLLDAQLGQAQTAARQAGMAVGIIHDLAVGVHPHGSDAWSQGEVLAEGVRVGAPPDMYNQQGQDWSQPPWRPDRLAECGYRPYRDMLRGVLRHAGGIRVDHVLGLFRLWWIPAGAPASGGTYVSYDHEALVGILALEAGRAGAVVIGEDLGTLGDRVRDLLRERGILGTSILWFERGDGDEVRGPQQWRSDVLASVTTHDLPPTAGYLSGEHVRLREQLGVLTRPAAEEWADFVVERDAWLGCLRELGLIGLEPTEEQLVEALHRFVALTPAAFVGVAVPDGVGDRRAQNQPGTDRQYPNWRVPLTDDEGRPVLLDDLPRHERLRSLARVIDECVRSHP
ncbi:MAG TPA: 4-alpha-glucanotransferase, partial [Candidatus Nanopelagicales bacterium]|nr:4-alpha-glucanotransferase [Candidatus Nanopelagicales bacterium]